MRAIAINIVLLITLFFLTTPSVVLNHKGHDPNSSDLKVSYLIVRFSAGNLWFGNFRVFITKALLLVVDLGFT